MGDQGSDATFRAPRASPAEPSPSAEQTLPAASGDAQRLGRGKNLGRYLVLGFLGEGGMAAVYAAYDPDLDRRVALKLLKISDDNLDAARSQLQREAQAMARLSHPNVVPVFDVGTYEGQLFVAMELVDGQTLQAWLEETPRSLAEIVRHFHAAGQGLAAAHAAGLVHRDFKPENVLIGSDGRVRVSDFGLAHLDERSAPIPAGPTTRRRHTWEGRVVGTPAYMAPEQFKGGATDARTDQFSFCAALWEAATGGLPFGGGTFQEIQQGVVSGELRPPRRALPRWLHAALRRGLSLEPGERFAALPELLAVLGRDRRLGRKLLTASLAITLVALVGGLGHQRYREATRCPREAGAASQALWGERRPRVAANLRGTSGMTPADEVLATLDRYVAQWAELRGKACEAARGGDDASARVVDCLERYRVEAGVVISTLADPGRAAGAGKPLLDNLGPPLRCPVPPRQASLPDPSLREAAAEARVLYYSGRVVEAAVRYRALLPKARSQGAWAVVSELEAGLAIARLEATGPDPDVLAELRQAVRDADASGDDERSLTARLGMADALRELGRTVDAEEVVSDADAWLRRMGKPPFLEQEALMLHAQLASNLGRHAEAAEHCIRALALADPLQTPDGDRAALRSNLGSVLIFAGRYSEAARALEQAAEAFKGLAWPRDQDRAAALTYLAIARRNQGRLEDARSAIEEAGRVLGPLQEQRAADALWVLAHRAAILGELGRDAEALGAVAQALQQEEALGPISRATALGARSRVLLRQGKPREALEAAVQAQRAFDDPKEDPQTVAQLRFALAEASAAVEPSAAKPVALAQEALALVSGPEDGFLRARMEAWLASRSTEPRAP